MRDADGSYNRHNDGAFDDITWEVGAPWVIRIDIEVGDASISLTERGAKLGQERVAIPTGRQRRLGWRVGGHDTQPLFTASIQNNVAGVRGMRMINCNRFGTDQTDTSVLSRAARDGGEWSDRSVGSQPTSRNPIKRHNKYQSFCRRVWRPGPMHWTRSDFKRPTECILHARERFPGSE